MLPELGKQGERWPGGSLGGVSSAESWDDGGDDTELRGRESGAAAVRIEGSWAGERHLRGENQTERHKDMQGQRETDRQTDTHTHMHTSWDLEAKERRSKENTRARLARLL